MRPVGAGVVTLLLALALGGLTRVPWTAGDPSMAVVRLSWRFLGEATRECRPLTDAEQAELPVHMRREEMCERRVDPYRLRVILDEREVVDERVLPGGARDDRPIYVFREIPVSPGPRSLRVVFEPAVPGSGDEARSGGQSGTSGREGAEAAEEEGTEAAPARLVLEDDVALAGGEVALITYDPRRRRLVLRRAVGDPRDP